MALLEFDQGFIITRSYKMCGVWSYKLFFLPLDAIKPYWHFLLHLAIWVILLLPYTTYGTRNAGLNF